MRVSLQLAAPHDPSFRRRSMPCLTDTTPVHAARQAAAAGRRAHPYLERAKAPSRVVVWQLVPQLVSRSLIQLGLRGPSCWRLRRPRGRQAKVFQDLLHHGPFGQGREYGHAPTTVLALQNVHLEHARQQLAPRNTRPGPLRSRLRRAREAAGAAGSGCGAGPSGEQSRAQADAPATTFARSAE